MSFYKHIALLLSCYFLTNMMGYAQQKNQNGGVVSEYLQFKAMADAAFDDGDFTKAQKLYSVCLTMIAGDEYANNRLKTSEETIANLKQLETTLKSSHYAQIEKALADLKASKLYNSPNSLLKNKVLVALENEADQKLKIGDYENAVRVYSQTYQILPVAGLVFKIERANQLYVEKNRKNMASYAEFLKTRKQKNQLTPIIPSADEADELRKKAEDAFAKGEWDKAQKLYNASLVVGEGKRPEIEQRLVDIARNKNLERQKEEADKEGNFLLSAKTGEEMLKIRPDNVQLKSDIANSYQKQADKYYREGRFADARDYYQKANGVESSSSLKDKVEDTETKIGELRRANETKRLEDIRTAKPTGKRNKYKPHTDTQWIGVAANAGLMNIQPLLSNAQGSINATGQMSWQMGGQAILRPNAAFNLALGASYQSVKFASVNTEKTNKTEEFKYTMLQIPLILSYTKNFGETGLGIRLQTGISLNKPLSYNYTNFVASTTQNDLSVMRGGISYSFGIGLTKTINKHKAVTVLVSYDILPTNLLNVNSLDTRALQRSSINAGVKSLNISLTFRVF